jgi:hypothetical protein
MAQPLEQGGHNAPALGQGTGMTIATTARVREVHVPKWEKIHTVQEFENWRHVVYTNMHAAAITEEDAEAAINRLEDRAAEDADLRNGMSTSQTQLDMELYRGIVGALMGSNTEATLAMTKIRSKCKIGRGMHALRILESESMLTGTRKKTESFTRMVEMRLDNRANAEQCLVFLTDMHTAQSDSGTGADVALEMLIAKIQHVKVLEPPYSAWIAVPNGTYDTLRDGLERYLKLKTKNDTPPYDAYAGYIPKGKGKGRYHKGGKGAPDKAKGKGTDGSAYGDAKGMNEDEQWHWSDDQEKDANETGSWNVPYFNGECRNCRNWGHRQMDCFAPGGGRYTKTKKDQEHQTRSESQDGSGDSESEPHEKRGNATLAGLIEARLAQKFSCAAVVHEASDGSDDHCGTNAVSEFNMWLEQYDHGRESTGRQPIGRTRELSEGALAHTVRASSEEAKSQQPLVVTEAHNAQKPQGEGPWTEVPGAQETKPQGEGPWTQVPGAQETKTQGEGPWTQRNAPQGKGPWMQEPIPQSKGSRNSTQGQGPRENEQKKRRYFWKPCWWFQTTEGCAYQNDWQTTGKHSGSCNFLHVHENEA